MARKSYDIRLVCAESGCNYTTYTTADTRREETDIRRRYAEKPYRCVRHTHPEEVLSDTNRERSTVMVAGKSEKYPHLDNLYWGRGSGFVSGPGFKAYAEDFPEGTKLIISARIELPEAGGSDVG